MIRTSDNTIWAAYNPVPHHNGCKHIPSTGRTPLVLQSSADNGNSWGALYTLEDDPETNYCYPAMIETRDGALLCSYFTYRYDEQEARKGHAHINASQRIVKVTLKPFDV